MKPDAIGFGIAGIVFGLIAGWVIGSQQASVRPVPSAPTQTTAAPAPSAPPAAALDEAKVSAAKAEADKDPANPAPRIQLANMYFDAERYSEAIEWYSQALKLSPRD